MYGRSVTEDYHTGLILTGLICLSLLGMFSVEIVVNFSSLLTAY